MYNDHYIDINIYIVIKNIIKLYPIFFNYKYELE